MSLPCSLPIQKRLSPSLQSIMNQKPRSSPRSRRDVSKSPLKTDNDIETDVTVDQDDCSTARFKLLRKYEQTVSDLKKALANERVGKKNIVEEIETLRFENRDLKIRLAKIETGVESMIYERISALETSLQERDAIIATQAGHIAKFQEFRVRVSEQTLKYRSEAETKIRALEKELASVHDQIITLRQASDEANLDKDMTIDELQKVLDTLTSKFGEAQLIREKTKLQTEEMITERDDEIQTLKDKLLSMESLLTAAKEKDSEITLLKGQVVSLQMRLASGRDNSPNPARDNISLPPTVVSAGDNPVRGNLSMINVAVADPPPKPTVAGGAKLDDHMRRLEERTQQLESLLHHVSDVSKAGEDDTLVNEFMRPSLVRLNQTSTI